MKLLITGATGFVGKHLLKALSKHEINILTRKEISGKNVFSGSLFEKEILLKASEVDIVIHLAGTADGDVFKVNYEGTKNLIDACVQNNVRKFIFVSSYDAVLNTDYGKSKLKAEEYLKSSGLNYIIFRPTVIYGKDNKKDIGKLIALAKLGIVPVPGDGNFKLQPLFVEDFVSIIVKSIESKHKNKIYSIGGGDALTFNEMVEVISNHLVKKVIKIKIPVFLIKLRNRTLLKDKVCSNEFVEKDFNFYPRRFEEAIDEIIT